jgi:hypothetical protein
MRSGRSFPALIGESAVKFFEFVFENADADVADVDALGIVAKMRIKRAFFALPFADASLDKFSHVWHRRHRIRNTDDVWDVPE